MNRSLWQDEAGVPGVIRESPIPSQIADEEIVVKVHAWAMNPADAMVQDIALPFIKYPLILGEDITGTVESVGSAAATKFQPGDRILGLALGAAVAKPEQGAFQDYVILDYNMACKIPDTLSFTDASVFPLCIATAAQGLFSKEYLGLPFPSTTTAPSSTGKSILIWGGSSGVGSNAIQLCKAAGFEVVTTCSARNAEYVKDLGADKVFDYTDKDAIDQVVTELDKGECIGILQAAGEPSRSCQVAYKSKQTLRVAATNPVPEGTAREGVEAKMIFASGGAVIQVVRICSNQYCHHQYPSHHYITYVQILRRPAKANSRYSLYTKIKMVPIWRCSRFRQLHKTNRRRFQMVRHEKPRTPKSYLSGFPRSIPKAYRRGG